MNSLGRVAGMAINNLVRSARSSILVQQGSANPSRLLTTSSTSNGKMNNNKPPSGKNPNNKDGDKWKNDKDKKKKKDDKHGNKQWPEPDKPRDPVKDMDYESGKEAFKPEPIPKPGHEPRQDPKNPRNRK